MYINDQDVLRNIIITESANSPILIARRQFNNIPEKKNILLDEATEEEMKYIRGSEYKGGIVL